MNSSGVAEPGLTQRVREGQGDMVSCLVESSGCVWLRSRVMGKMGQDSCAPGRAWLSCEPQGCGAEPRLQPGSLLPGSCLGSPVICPHWQRFSPTQPAALSPGHQCCCGSVPAAIHDWEGDAGSASARWVWACAMRPCGGERLAGPGGRQAGGCSQAKAGPSPAART